MHKVIRARNVQDAYLQGIRYLNKHGSINASRNGQVLVAPGPVMTEYQRPIERVILDHGRDANPFFHLMEAIWMLCGREDVASISQYNSRMATYSDDGVTFNAPYGHRWRRRFGFDQIQHVVEQLRHDYATRRAVIQMWDGFKDGVGESKDFPCNTAVFFRVRLADGFPRGYLDMTITNRSNDIIWGAYGANAVHMSVLHELVAALAGYHVGKMYQLSNNYHAYVDIMHRVGDPQKKWARAYAGMGALTPTYLFSHHCRMLVQSRPLFEALEAWWEDRASQTDVQFLISYMGETGYGVIDGMRTAWRLWKEKRLPEALEFAADIPGEDWSRACVEWLQRRKPARIGSHGE